MYHQERATDSASGSRRETHNQDHSIFPQAFSSKRPPRIPLPRVPNHTLSLKVEQIIPSLCDMLACLLHH